MAKNTTKKKEPANGSAGKRNFLLKPVPMFVPLVVVVLLGLFFVSNTAKKSKVDVSQAVQKAGSEPGLSLILENDTGLIRPILLVESSNEEESLIPTKIKIENYIAQKQKDGTLTTASVYLNDLNTVGSVEVNGAELYDPASIMKVPMMMIYLKRARRDTDLLNKKILFDKKIESNYEASIRDRTITLGKTYTVKELLYYMIVYSDNEAFWMLAKDAKYEDFTGLCHQLGIPLNGDDKAQADGKQNFVANVNSISRFFRVLYNASYLGRRLSEYAMDLLSKSDYHDGIMKGVDANIRVANKFGERGENGVNQLHDFGIIYIKNNPYLLGVMTKGKDKIQLAGVVSAISKIAYDDLKQLPAGN